MAPPPPRWLTSLRQRRRFDGLAEGTAELAENANKIVAIYEPALGVDGGAFHEDGLEDVGR